MADQYFGDNFIPGLNVKNINAAVINPLMQLGGQIGSAYDQYGKRLRSALGQNQEDFAQQFLAGKLPGQKQLQRPNADLRGSITPGSLQPAASNKGEGAAMDAAERSRAGAGYPAGVIRPGDYPMSSSPKAPALSAKELVNKHGSVEKAEDAGMMEWAKANKDLAEKVKPGQAGYDAIQLALGKTTALPDEIRAFAEDHGRTKEEARAILGGGSVETVIDGNKPMITTINQLNPDGTPKQSEAVAVETAAPNFPYTMADFVGSEVEIGDMFAPQMQTNIDDFSQAFLLDRIQAQKADPAKKPHPLSHFYSNRYQFK